MNTDWASDPTRWQPPAASGGEDELEWTDTFIRQSEWGVGRKGWISNSVYLLLALFFGGIGAGAALMALYLARAHSGWYFVAGYLLAVGGKGVFHLLFLGNPLRFWRAVCRPQTSWVSRGIIALGLFSVAGGAYVLGPMWGLLPALVGAEPLLAGLCGVLLTFLIVYDGFLLNNATAIGAWSTSLMVILFPVFSALGGAGLLGTLYGPLHARVPLDIHALHQIEAVLLVVGAFALATYLATLHADPFLRTSAWEAVIGRLRWVFWMVVVGGGIVAPLVVAVLNAWMPVAISVMATVALVAVIGDYAFKYVIFSIGGYRQQYTPVLGRVARPGTHLRTITVRQHTGVRIDSVSHRLTRKGQRR
jgi:formate-dependent nitrite reductase membrane component NrfD